MDDSHVEFLFVFNDKERAEAAAEEVRRRGYSARILSGDGEGRHFQLRLEHAGRLTDEEVDRLAYEELRPLLAGYRGRFEGSFTSEPGAFR